MDNFEHYKTLFQNLNEAFALHKIIFDENKEPIDYIFLEVNNAFAKHYNISIEDFKNNTALKLFPITTPSWIKLYSTVALTGQPMQFTYYSDELDKYFETRIYSPEKEYFAILLTDISERIEVEMALRESKDMLFKNEQRLKMALNATSDAIWEWNYVNGKTHYSARWYEMLGYEPQEFEMTFDTWKKLCHPEDYEKTVEKINSILHAQSNKGYNAEFRMRQKNGKWLWVLGRGNVVKRDEKGNPLLLSGTNTDISERKLAEKALQEAERRVLSASIEAEERERNYFARELHDGIGPLLSTIKLYFQWLNMPNLHTPKEEIFANANATIQEAIETVKEISHKLSPHILTNFGLVFAVKSFIEKLKGTTKIKIDLTSNNVERFNSDIEVTLYRVIIECINNTIKYANAQNITINFTKEQNLIKVTYTDDGIGFNYDETINMGKGIGLFNMQNRIKVLGGNFTVESQINNGVLILVSITI